MDARTEPKGYKSIIEGGDKLNNCTKLDILKLNDKCIYLISTLTHALLSYPTKTWIQCCQDASNSCSINTTSYSTRTIADWWQIFRQKNASRIHEELSHPQKSPKNGFHLFFETTKICTQNFVRHCTLNLADLSIDLAREFVIDTLIPEAFPLTANNPECKDLLQRLYKMSKTPS
jgi:hypothetical protein